MVRLGPGEVHLWWAAPADFTADALGACTRFLPDDERAASARFVFEEDRRQALLARAVVRHALAQVEGGMEAGAWRFTRTPYGRPVIADASFDWLSFSLSHTRSLVVCAVAARSAIGVDVESLAREPPLEVAGHYFARDEAAELMRAPPATRAHRFLEYWTLKEAFVKALGLGLSVPLDSFSFHLAPGDIGISFSGGLAAEGHDPARWSFHSGEIPAPAHVLALACAGAHGRRPLQIALHAAEPLLRGGAPSGGG
jgi:4'-phosphopantetheinyl transferase